MYFCYIFEPGWVRKQIINTKSPFIVFCVVYMRISLKSGVLVGQKRTEMRNCDIAFFTVHPHKIKTEEMFGLKETDTKKVKNPITPRIHCYSQDQSTILMAGDALRAGRSLV